MLREILTQSKRANRSGFALPTVMIVAVVMMIILVTAVQASASVRTALSNQYYNNLAAEAAESGVIFAQACIQSANGYASWSQLQPNLKCSGESVNGVASRYIIDKPDMRTTFTVSNNSDPNVDQYNLTVSGSVQLLRASNREIPWKTINVKRKMQAQPCTKTVTNLIANPSFEVDTSGWSPYSGTNIARTTNAAAPPITDGNYTMLVQSAGNNNESFAESALSLQAGKTYTVSGVLHRPGVAWNSTNNNTVAYNRKLAIVIFAYIPSTTSYFEAKAQSDSTDPGHRRVSSTFTIPSNATSTFMRLYNGAVSGDVYWDSIMLSEDNKDAGFKDGDAPGWVWNGTYNNATSTGPVKTACTSTSTCNFTNLIPNPNIENGTANWTGTNVTFAQDSTWSAGGTYSLRTNPSTTSGDSYVSIGGDDGGLRLGMQPGKTYTVSATMRIASDLTGTNYLPWRRAGIMVGTWNPIAGFTLFTANSTGVRQFNSGEPQNQSTYVASGVYKLKTTFTVPLNAPTAFIRLYNGGTNGQTPVYWDSVALYEGTRAPYYDGDSSGWSWSGSPNLSTSSGPVVPCNVPISY